MPTFRPALAASVVCALLLAAATPGQLQFVEAGAQLPADNDRSWWVVVHDLDGDGKLDVFFANDPGPCRLYAGDGNGTFVDVTATRLPQGTMGTRARVGDLDGDGDPDIVLEGMRPWLLNDGRGNFTLSASGLVISQTVDVGDLDGDGDLDVVKGGYRTAHTVWLNNGKGNFTDVSSTHMPVTQDELLDAELGDIDGDGDLDYVIANGHTGPQLNRLFRNDGQGRFTEISSTNLPAHVEASARVLFADFDRDGDLDLFFANGHWNPGTSRLYLNDGSGKFADATPTHMPNVQLPCHAAAAGDIDDDGDVDLVLVLWRQPAHLMLNDGTGKFTDVTNPRLVTTAGETLEIALADVDGDADLDIVLPYLNGTNRLYLNRHRHVSSSSPMRIGQNHFIDYDNMPGYAPSAPQVVRPYFSFGRASQSIPLPGYGTLHLDLATFFDAPSLLAPGPRGVATLWFFVPNDPQLRGLKLCTQAITVQFFSTTKVHLTHMHSDVFQ